MDFRLDDRIVRMSHHQDTAVLSARAGQQFARELEDDLAAAEGGLGEVRDRGVLGPRDGRYPKNSFGRLVGRLVEPLFVFQLVVQSVGY